MLQALNQIVNEKFSNYPDDAQTKLLEVRELLFNTVDENNLGDIEETLKWNEPAYLVKGGSTIRIDWKAASPDKIFIFFSCKTALVETFKEVYFDVFTYQGNRAIELDINRPIAADELKHCLLMALRYHKLKHLPLLGAC